MADSDSEEKDPRQDFRLLTVFPTMDDLYETEPFIRAAKIKEPYDSVEHYLDVQFRLLREDFLTPLRKGLHEYLNGGFRYRNNDLRVYKKVRLMAPVHVSKQNNVGIKVFFGILEKVVWRDSRRFTFGGLLLLSSNDFDDVIFATVVSRDEADLKDGYVLIEPIENTVITPQMFKATYVMLESKIYFEPYKAVLSAMKLLKEDNFPMKNYLAYASTASNLPAYCKGKSLFANEQEPWIVMQKKALDESQFRAYKHALTEEFSVIQGPPGTGKTFIALEIVRTLIGAKSLWQKYGPIVVVCFTNHALDQFLEGILEHTDSIVRIGDRSKSEKLKRFTLKEKRNSFNPHEHDDYDREEYYEVKNYVQYILKQIGQIESVIELLTNPKGIVPLKILRGYVYDTTLSKLNSNKELISWLLGDLNLDEIDKNEYYTEYSLEDERIHDFYHRHSDRQLDFEFEFREEDFQPILLLKILEFYINMIDNQIRHLSNYELLEQDETNFILQQRNYVYQLQNFRETLIQKQLFVMQQLEYHSILNRNRSLPDDWRWNLYWKWVEECYERAIENLSQLREEYNENQNYFNELKQLDDLNILKEHLIVGLTTTGAARLQTMLIALKAPILLIEEAAEILESHVLVSMTKNCQHVILIGDHKQLRPKASDFELGRKYNLNISLFERIVRIRGDCVQLTQQHRMRPEISALITPSIYKTLFNHESVYKFPKVKGVKKNLFFINHTHPEISYNEESWVNHHEAIFLIRFSNYLIKQGYAESEITILCTYIGQLFELRKEKNKFSQLKNINVQTVDNYQGEENKIILLSLVRNNGEGNIGFLREENRVCVALSRAKEGLYIMGNMDDLENNNKIWPKLKKVFESQNSIGDSLELVCGNHPEKTTNIKNVIDFELCPYGGCFKICGAPLNCGHRCNYNCHIQDQNHVDLKCKQPCLKFCPADHPCPLKCHQGCSPCIVKVECELPCGHTAQKPCSTDGDKFFCYIEVSAILPGCGHEVKKKCSEPIEQSSCSHPCETRLPCGHSCEKNCHVTKDPDHIEYKCLKECTRNYLACEKDHSCKKRCYEECGNCPEKADKERSCGHFYKNIKCSDNVESIECKRPCKQKLNCGHNCKLVCSQTCDQNCTEKVKKKISSCGHEIFLKCYEEASSSKCNEKCKKNLNCGHPCTGKCKESCSTIPCLVNVNLDKPAQCGHIFAVPCHLRNKEPDSPELMKHCDNPCPGTLKCGHKCKGICGKCLKSHAACQEPCSNILICGHKCDLNCTADCRPCQRPCKIKCSHGKICNKKCAQSCQIRCKSDCNYGCKHRRCTKKCMETCDVEPCHESCPKFLECGHPCLGFCGEPCPHLCRTCNIDELKELFPDNEVWLDETRLILLEDCNHCMRNEDFLKFTEPHDKSTVILKIKCCPQCNTPITRCKRFFIQSKMSLEDISQVKNIILNDKNKSKEVWYKDITTGKIGQKNKFGEVFDPLRTLLRSGFLTGRQRRSNYTSRYKY